MEIHRPALAWLKWEKPDKTVDTIFLNPKTTVIGRYKGDVLLADFQLSPCHCQIQQLQGVYHIFDLRSDQGVFVNGQKIIKSVLNPKDRIQLGQTEWIFESSTEFDFPENWLKKPYVFKTIPKPESSESLQQAKKQLLQRLHWTLNITFSNGTHGQYIVQDNPLILGRALDWGFFNQDVALSRHHAQIHMTPDGIAWVEDLGSKNGTFVNSCPITGPTMLSLNGRDLVILGHTELQISYDFKN